MRYFLEHRDGQQFATIIARRQMRCKHLGGFWVRVRLDDDPTPEEIEARLNEAARAFADGHDCRECERP